MKLLAAGIFVATYVLMILFTRRRVYVALTAAVLFLLLGVIPLKDAILAVDWNVLLMLAGTMGTVSLFTASKMPNRLADLLLQKTPSAMWAAVVMSLFAGIVSAFVDNVATVLMLAPVGLAIAKRLGISPVPLLISISVSSNLQGAATLVGDTTSIMLGGYADMDFLDFFFFQGRFSIFWGVELGAVATIPVLLFLFRRDRGPIPPMPATPVEDYVPSILLLGNVALLILASFLPEKPALTNGLICMGIFLLGAARTLARQEGLSTVQQALAEIDGATLLLLGGLFVVIAGVERAGVIDAIAQFMVTLGGGNLFLTYTVIVWGSVLMSAFIDNIPYVATMLPVVTGIAGILECSPYVLYFGLLVGATLGGNLTPIGASANITTIGILEKNGCTVRGRDFLRIGVPFTLVAVICGYVFCWLVWR